MIGDAGVGKTCIFRQYNEREFSFTKLPTLGVDFCIKTHEIDGDDVKVRPFLSPSIFPSHYNIITMVHGVTSVRGTGRSSPHSPVAQFNSLVSQP